ncbi:Mu-like prophage FluMu DNA transposition protein B [Spirochaetia bacterium]|nr:Mu-like prophage FluMu DNA transposition protein B [Spirochaetia bacterium]
MSDIFDEGLYKRFFDVVGSPEEGKRISQSKAAQALGYSSGVISAYKGRSYNGNVKEVEARIEAWLNREARRLATMEVPTAETTTMEQVRRAITIAQDEADIAVIIGEAGTGKTTALRQYAKESHSALLIEVDPSFSKVVLMNEIAHALGVEDKGGMNAVIDRVVDTLKDRDAVLIIDEADYLSDSSLELIRRIINDKAHTGVVLVGLPQLEYKIRNLRNDHEQLISRVGVFVKLGKLKKADAEKIITGVWPELPKETLDTFVKTANGSTRTLVKLMGRVHQIMGINRAEKPDGDIIAAASELLMR